MRAKTTTGMGKEHEEAVVEAFAWASAWRSKSSGANFAQPVDVTCDVAVVECEATEKQSYNLKRSFWQEVNDKQHSGKMPALAIRFRDTTGKDHLDLAVIKLSELSSLLEEVEAYRDEAVERN